MQEIGTFLLFSVQIVLTFKNSFHQKDKNKNLVFFEVLFEVLNLKEKKLIEWFPFDEIWIIYGRLNVFYFSDVRAIEINFRCSVLTSS